VFDFSPVVIDDLLRITVAAIVGMAVGLNRDVNDKPMGMRTLGLVSLGAALVGVAALEFGDLRDHPDAASRVIQGVVVGVMTGVGFLGAGAILRDSRAGEVHGLTTAATTWLAAALGVACAFAAWHLVIAGAVLTLAILVAMLPVERALVRAFGGDPDPGPADPAKAEAPPSKPDDRVVTRLTGYN